MNLRQLKYVYTVAQEGTMRKAAEKLYVTEPTISHQIKELENFLDLNLFERRGRNIVLSREGKILKPFIKRVLLAVEDIHKGVEDIKNPECGQITLGIGPISARNILPSLLPKFNKIYPNVKLSVIQGGSIELVDMLLNDVIDVGVISTNYDTKELLEANDIEFKIISEVQFILVISKDHPFSKKNEVSIYDLKNENVILYRKSMLREMLINYLGKEFEDNILFSMENNESTRELIKLNMGITVLPYNYVHKWTEEEKRGLVFKRIYDFELKLEPTCIYMKNRYLPKYLEVFVEEILHSKL